ncbi:Protein kinase [Phytophthora megakarya]|uniref:Protein kinase n=1 Tax=Phytophthora megakarya TaxID=4795 RepID=A0A225WU94_9STRA|nr:Protein kinase [Phytophthora megakarya]
MRARRAVTGPCVQEDGDMELQILRQLGRNVVYASQLQGDTSTWSVSPVWTNDVDDGGQHLLTLHQDFVDYTTKTRCLLFDYCPFGDLFSHVSSRARNDGLPKGLPIDMARSCFLQIASAVRFLHTRNVAHRDLSLENVLLDSFRRCRLADFGLASAVGSRCSGARVGKMLYMAPEVFARSPYRPDAANVEMSYNGLQADIWSLGVLLFILVTGIPPFERAGEVDARFRLVSKPGGSVRELLRVWDKENQVPSDLRTLLDWMLRVDPRQRPTAEQVCGHEWLLESDTLRELAEAKAVPRWSTHGEKRPSAEPEEEEDGENLEPQKMARVVNQSDKPGAWSSNKRLKRME